MKKISELTPGQLHDLAKIVDNDYIGKDKVVEVTHSWADSRTIIQTNTCDMCSKIRVEWTGDTWVNGDYTDGWQRVQPETQEKISKYLNDL